MSVTSIGLWLIGWGSFLVVATAFAAPPDATLGLRFRSRDTTLRQRVVFAVQTTGLGLVAVGSLAVALSQHLEWWLILATVLAVAGAVDVLMAWPLKRAWDEKSEMAALMASSGEMGKTAAAQHQAEIGRRCATWRWCLLHPFNSESWPGMSAE
jgi:predicted lysophospholipase L1 biosynthesis ABC-type transport system permease subunit